jgi:hypothetical protein
MEVFSCPEGLLFDPVTSTCRDDVDCGGPGSTTTMSPTTNPGSTTTGQPLPDSQQYISFWTDFSLCSSSPDSTHNDKSTNYTVPNGVTTLFVRTQGL